MKPVGDRIEYYADQEKNGCHDAGTGGIAALKQGNQLCGNRIAFEESRCSEFSEGKECDNEETFEEAWSEKNRVDASE